MLTVYTDGSSKPNPGHGGAGFVIIDSEENICCTVSHYGGNNTTNNRMELQAIILLFDFIPNDIDILIYTDSQYVKNGMEKWLDNWVAKNWIKSDGKKVLNQDLWSKLVLLRKLYPKISFRWVKAHNNNKWNDLADKLANIGSDKGQNCSI